MNLELSNSEIFVRILYPIKFESEKTSRVNVFQKQLELCTGAGVPEPELRYILLEPELETSSKNSGTQNYEKLILM